MRLNSDQIEEVIKKPIISIVATLRKDGSAHMTPVWHILHEDFVYIVIEDSSVKSKNLKNDDRISLCIATETKPQKWVQINGKAHLTKNNIQELVTLMAIHYLGKSEGAEYSKNVLKELDFIAVKILPDKVIGFDMAEE